LGTPQKLITATGETVWSASYDTFGRATVAGGSTIENNLRFPGQYFDAETGFHYNWHRYYIPELGRYNRLDPIKDDRNWYGYVGGNFLSRYDPFGLAAGAPYGSPDEAAKAASDDILKEEMFCEWEWGAVIYKLGDKYYHSPIYTDERSDEVTHTIDPPPGGVPVAFIHSHPCNHNGSRNFGRAKFSQTDKNNANRRRKPTYVVFDVRADCCCKKLPDPAVLRYDPQNGNTSTYSPFTNNFEPGDQIFQGTMGNPPVPVLKPTNPYPQMKP
jgi:RHS repeat-associated protein